MIVAQNILISIDHAIYHFLEQQESQGHLNGEYWSTRPYTYSQINKMLSEIDTHALDISETDLQILSRFKKEFNREIDDEGIELPWSQSTWQKIKHPTEHGSQPFFMTYKQDNASGWISWSETFRIQYNGEGTRGYHTDHLEISGSKGPIDFTTQYTYHRVTRNEDFNTFPESYKEGYILDRDYVKWITWDYPTSSLSYTHPDFKVGIHRQPVYWGYSSTNSPIISNNVNPLPYVDFETQTRHLRFKFIHSRLSPNSQVRDDTTNVRRNLSAHRVEFDLGPSFEFAFTEMIIYSHRDFELGYLNPVNFLFAEEHVQGNLDNKLMAIDFKWRVIPGLTSYGTWFFDELDFWKLFSGWWGNKFVLQLGATYYPKSNLPSINLEYTAARPWTYSHKDQVNAYSSAGRALGLMSGPNSENLRFSSFWQVNSKLNIQGQIKFIRQGDGPGTSILDSPSGLQEEETGFLTGTQTTTSQASLSMSYFLSNVSSVDVVWHEGNFVEIGLKLMW